MGQSRTYALTSTRKQDASWAASSSITMKRPKSIRYSKVSPAIHSSTNSELLLSIKMKLKRSSLPSPTKKSSKNSRRNSKKRVPSRTKREGRENPDGKAGLGPGNTVKVDLTVVPAVAAPAIVLQADLNAISFDL